MYSDSLRMPFQTRRAAMWMRIFTVLLALIVLAVAATADARRFGGGRSFGRQSPSITNNRSTNPPAQRNNSAQNARNPQQNAAGQAARKPWGGVLGGIAAGLGLAALFHWLGFGPLMGEMLGTLMLILLGVIAISFIFRMLRRPTQQAAGAGAGAGNVGGQQAYDMGNNQDWAKQQSGSSSFQPQAGSAASAGVDYGNWGRQEVPAGFDVQAFEKVARDNFMRLQKAWDAADLGSLRAFLTDEMYDEMKRQLQDRHGDFSGRLSQTDVVMLNVKLLGIEDANDAHVASVDFSGMIREEVSAGAQPFHEVWNLTKDKSAPDSGWLLAGIQVISS